MYDPVRRYLSGELITLLRLLNADPAKWECRRSHDGEPEPVDITGYRVIGAGGRSAPHHLDGAKFVASRKTEPVCLRVGGAMVDVPAYLIAIERDAYMDALENATLSQRMTHYDLMQMSFPLVRVTSEGYVRRNNRVSVEHEACARELFTITHVRELSDCVA
jgi:hypothetical protein